MPILSAERPPNLCSIMGVAIVVKLATEYSIFEQATPSKVAAAKGGMAVLTRLAASALASKAK